MEKQIMEKEKVFEILNEKISNHNISKLLIKIGECPDRFVGTYRASKPKAKIIQNLSQSQEIKFGDALENLFEAYFEASGYRLLNKKIHFKGDDLNIDQLFIDDNKKTIYYIEQKVRDDHDSSKKKGQFNNFKAKYEALSVKYETYKIISIMWFIDDALKKNKKYYNEQLNEMDIRKGDEKHIFYNDELFTLNLKENWWNEFLRYLEEWKKGLEDFPEINLDTDVEKNLEELCLLKDLQVKKLFKDERIVSEILPIIFPEGTILRKYKEIILQEKNEKRYKLLEPIDTYLVTLQP